MLSSYMKIISSNIIKHYKRKIINIHPSLLPKFKGLNTFSRMLKNKDKLVVLYVNEKLDSGKYSSKNIFINRYDNESSLKEKTQKLEYKFFPET